jgi:hypothetical protein
MRPIILYNLGRKVAAIDVHEHFVGMFSGERLATSEYCHQTVVGVQYKAKLS